VSRPLVTETAEQIPGAWRIPATQLEHLIATEAATSPRSGRQSHLYLSGQKEGW
jgi:hypothetical protein